ncbi:ankyrin-3 [Biomphalaria glabrata]|nr:ankyrin-3-like; partial [Biomphalaria glabrata]KAI8787368.1 ankyrin-3 [Biomphalaria glabrata]
MSLPRANTTQDIKQQHLKEVTPENRSKTPLFTIEETGQSDNHSDGQPDGQMPKDKTPSEVTKKEQPVRITSGSSSGIGSKSSDLSDTSSEGSAAAKNAGGVELSILTLCKKGDWLSVEKKLKSAPLKSLSKQIVEKDEITGLTPLILAVQENRLNIVEGLIDKGADVNDLLADGRTALHFAAASSRDDTVRTLLAKNANPLVTGGPLNTYPLHLACARSSGALSITKLLLTAMGKDARTVKDKDGMIPLLMAVEAGNVLVIKELLTQNGQAQITCRRTDTGDTALHLACRKKDLETVKLLVDAGINLDLKNKDGQTAVHISTWEGDENVLRYLYSVGANFNVQDKLERMPLHIAAERGHTDLVEFLISHCKATLTDRTQDGSTLIHIASKYGHPETALAFLKKGVPLLMPNKDGAICLHVAAMMGHTAVVKALIAKGAAVNATTKDGQTALHLAVKFRKPQVVQALIGSGAQVETKGGEHMETPLHIAARTEGGEKCAEMLFKSGADVNSTRENGETALHVSARYGGLSVLRSLLREGANPMHQSKAGETALHIATRHCHLDIVKELQEFVCQKRSLHDAITLANQQNVEGEAPIHCAAEIKKSQAHNEFEDTDLVRLILSYNANVTYTTKLTQESCLHYCARSGNADIMLEIVKHLGPQIQSIVNKQSRNGQSPLLVASEQGHLDIVKILLKNQARVDIFDEHGKTALHLAAENGHEQVADMLLYQKAFVNAKSKHGLTPLHLAASNGNVALVKLLIEKHGATIDALTLAKKTSLHMAAQNGQKEVCAALIKMKADTNATDVQGQTPLHLAAENNHSDVVKLFLKHRPELVTMANINGMTCAHIAAAKGSAAVIKELMRFNKTIITTARNKTNDSTALHLAAEGGHAQVVKILLEAGASALDENADGMTALHLAAKHGHIETMNELKKYIPLRTASEKTGLTALHVAAHFGKADFVREMLINVSACVKCEAPVSLAFGIQWSSEAGMTPLHFAAQSGHEGLVRILLNCPGVQTDSSSSVTGSIPLHLAAGNGHTSVVSLLLSKSTYQIHTKDKRGRTALLRAAANGHLEMCALLIGQGADINTSDKNGFTALHFASSAGYLNVVKLLVESGASPNIETKDGKVPITFATSANHIDVLSFLMKRDHNTRLLMEDKKFVFDLMVCGRMNNNKCLEEFILLSPAPVDTAAKLARSYQLQAIKEKERSRDLVAASTYCEAMAVELTAIASNVSSARKLLKALDHHGTPFLDVLIDMEQKEVVAHPAVQKYLSDVWMGELRWANWKIVMLFFTLLFIPPVWVLFSLPSRHRFNKVPIIKFMTYLVSHFYLMILFSLVIVAPLVPIYLSTSLIPHWYEWILLAWLSGLLVSELTNPGDRQGLGWIRTVNLGICAIAIFCHLLGAAFEDEDRMQMLYIRNQFMAWALLLTFVQLLEFLSFHHLFGPWAIIIRDLIKDLVRFLVILLIFMIGFTLHLTAIYQPVFSPTESQEVGTAFVSPPSLTPLDTFEFLFFALFGLTDPNSFPPFDRSPMWTTILLKVVFGTFMMITFIVLINLLIAMMSDTYQRIQQQSDVEWKFGRAKLIRNMNKTSATPAPLNLFTKPIFYLKLAIKLKCKLWSPLASTYLNDEDHDTMSDSRSMDNLGGSSYKLWKRKSTVEPMEPQIQHAQNLEDVVDWKLVTHRYMVMQGAVDPESEASKGFRTFGMDALEEQMTASFHPNDRNML